MNTGSTPRPRTPCARLRYGAASAALCLALVHVFAFVLGVLVAGRVPVAPAWLWVTLALALLAVDLLFARCLVGALSAMLAPVAAALRGSGSDWGNEAAPVTGPRPVRQLAGEVNRIRTERKRHAAEAAAMTAAISHDLQTPITRLRLRADLIPDAALRERFAADLDAVTAMLREQLDYVRSEHVRENYVPIDLARLVESVAEGMLDMGQRVTVQGGFAHPYLGALRAVERILQNLVSNAVAFGGSALIELSESADAAVIMVIDPGPGVPPDQLERVFEPFYRVETSRNRSRGGTGLGLAIARNLARAHGGDIRLANRQDRGFEAVFTMPASLRAVALGEGAAARCAY